MSKLNITYEKLISSWNFLYISIYGIIAFIIGLSTLLYGFTQQTLNILDLPSTLILTPTFLNGFVSILTFISGIIAITSLNSTFKFYLYFLIVLFTIIIAIYIDKTIPNTIGMGITILCYKQLPLTICLLIIPALILSISKIQKQLPLLTITLKHRYLSSCFYIYGIVCLLLTFVISAFVKIIFL